MWRTFQMNKSLSKDGHVWSKFGSGNRESLSKAGRDLKAKGKLNGNGSPKVNGVTPSPMTSLRPSPIPSRGASPAPSVASTSSELDADGGTVGRETRRRLVEWWSKEYCSSRMSLCVIGKGKYVTFPGPIVITDWYESEPLEDLTDMVSSLFSPIKNRGQDPLPAIDDHPFGPNETNVCICHILTYIPRHFCFFYSDLSPSRRSWHSTLSKYISLLISNLHDGGISLETSLRTS
jgi:insulysin